MSYVLRVAVPVESGTGLDAVFSPHFGHAPGFALIDVSQGASHFVRMIENPPHGAGGCGATVSLLVANGVRAVVAGGMGRGPLVGLANAGVAVFRSSDAATVGDAVAAYIEGTVEPFELDQSCQGHHH